MSREIIAVGSVHGIGTQSANGGCECGTCTGDYRPPSKLANGPISGRPISGPAPTAPPITLTVTISGDSIGGHLSVGDDPGHQLAFIDVARLLSDLACATTVLVLGQYDGQPISEDVN